MPDGSVPPRERPLRVCYFGTYAPEHTRTQILVRGLRAAGAIVYECNEPFWASISDRVRAASGGWFSPLFWLRLLRVYAKLIFKYLRAPAYDVLLIGYPGQIDAYPAHLLARLAGRPLALDFLMSLHLVAEERGLTAKHRLTGALIFALERTALRLPDLVFCENGDYEAYLRRKYDLTPRRFCHIGHGVNDALYAPRPAATRPDGPFRVTYHGLFLKSHGIPTMIRAAGELRNRKDVAFTFYGDGPERASCMALARELGLENTEFPGFVDQEALLNGIAMSDLALGVFGTTRHALMTVQNKVWEALGMGRPLVSGDSPTIRSQLTHGVHLYLVERENPAALAKAILDLKADPALRAELGRAAVEYVRSHNSIGPLGRAAMDALRVRVRPR